MAKHEKQHKPKKFRLNVVGAVEDQPRLIRAYGRACMGEFALVLRPREAKGLLVLITKEGATKWEPGEGADSPGAPAASIDVKEAVARVKAAQKGAPAPGPTTLRGQWSGYLHCDDGKPRVEMKRPLAAYGTLWITSHMDAGWSWRFQRGEKWFAEPGDLAGENYPTLARAIEAGVLGAMKLVSEACSFRDTRRRAAHDAAYAAEHPIKPAKEGKDPTERLKEPKRVHHAKKAAPPAPVEAPLAVVPEPPSAPADMERMAEAATREADALQSLAGTRWLWEEATSPVEIAAWFRDHGFESIAETVERRVGSSAGPEDTAQDVVADVEREVAAAEGYPEDGQTAETFAEARRQVARLKAHLESAPAHMERARKLIRYAASMSRSKLCQGKEQREAAEAVERAVAAYEDARKAINAGRAWDAVRTLRRIGERVALAAAKAARSCTRGQQSLTAAAKEAPATVAPAKPKRERKARKGRGTEAPAPEAAEAADPEKDKALVDAFSKAIAAAMAGEAA